MNVSQSKRDESGVQAQAQTQELPGKLLKEARLAQQIGEREAADRLNWMPGYVAIIERDEYEALRAPAFARGYVKAYARLLQIDEDRVLTAFDRLRGEIKPGAPQRIETHSMQLQHTGLGVVTGLAVLLLLVFALWWFGGKDSNREAGQANPNDSLVDER